MRNPRITIRSGASHVAHTHKAALHNIPGENDDPVLPCGLGKSWLGVCKLLECVPGPAIEFSASTVVDRVVGTWAVRIHTCITNQRHINVEDVSLLTWDILRQIVLSLVHIKLHLELAI